jgi:mitochondrial ornithine carrier protein
MDIQKDSASNALESLEVISSSHLPHRGREAFKDVAFGSLAGIAGKFVEYPFDTVKVRLQSRPDTISQWYTGPIDCFKQMIAKEGFGGLYRGLSAPLVGAAVETSSLFFSVSILRGQTVHAS